MLIWTGRVVHRKIQMFAVMGGYCEEIEAGHFGMYRWGVRSLQGEIGWHRSEAYLKLLAPLG